MIRGLAGFVSDKSSPLVVADGATCGCVLTWQTERALMSLPLLIRASRSIRLGPYLYDLI